VAPHDSVVRVPSLRMLMIFPPRPSRPSAHACLITALATKALTLRMSAMRG